MKRTVTLILLVLLLAFLLAQTAHAQGPVTPPPPPVTPVLPVNPVDAANARADQWESVARGAVASAQASINSAWSSLYAAQASVAQSQVAFQQADAARIAAQQGQIQAAVDAGHAAQVASVQAVGLATASGQYALDSIQQSGDALRAVSELRADLTAKEAQNVVLTQNVAQLKGNVEQAEKDKTALATALVMERQRSDLLKNVAISFFLLLITVIICIALLLWRIVLALRPAGRDRMVVMNERGEVKAQIEALS